MSDNPGPCVLYVEDEPLVRELGIAALEEGGFEVLALASGSAAIKAVDADDGRIRAIVTDIDLVPGPNGWEVARRARERSADMPIIYVSGGSAGDWASLGVPGSVMIMKPYAAAQLVVAVSNALLGPGPSASTDG